MLADFTIPFFHTDSPNLLKTRKINNFFKRVSKYDFSTFPDNNIIKRSHVSVHDRVRTLCVIDSMQWRQTSRTEKVSIFWGNYHPRGIGHNNNLHLTDHVIGIKQTVECMNQISSNQKPGVWQNTIYLFILLSHIFNKLISYL